MFPKPYTEWSEAQKDFYYWLQFNDMVYDRINNQFFISEIDIFEPYMIKYPIAVDCFLLWYDRKSERKRQENKKPSEPSIDDYPVAGQPAHF